MQAARWFTQEWVQYVLYGLYEWCALLSLSCLPQGPPCYSGKFNCLPNVVFAFLLILVKVLIFFFFLFSLSFSGTERIPLFSFTFVGHCKSNLSSFFFQISIYSGWVNFFLNSVFKKSQLNLVLIECRFYFSNINSPSPTFSQHPNRQIWPMNLTNGEILSSILLWVFYILQNSLGFAFYFLMIPL